MGREADKTAPGPAFLQIGDLRLAGVPDARLRLRPEQRELRRIERRSALAAACRTAAERKADFVLITGDLFDSPVVPDVEWDFAVEHLAGLAPRPVIIAPGDRDPNTAEACWSPNLAADRGRRPWPGNVHVFGAGGWQAVRPAGLDLTFVGRSAPADETADLRLADDGAFGDLLPDGSCPAVLVHHGAPAGLRVSGKPSAGSVRPPAEAELPAGPFVYMAFGGSPRGWLVRGPGGVRAADAGAGFSDWPAVPTPRGGLFGRLCADPSSAGGGGATELESLPLDHRNLREIRVDLSGAGGAEEIRRRILAAVRESGAGPADMIHVVAAGLYRPGAELPASLSSGPDAPCFHLQADWSAARPDYDLESLRGEGAPRATVERRFVAHLMSRIEAVGDEAEADRLEAALNAGLDALRHGRIGFRV
jgi:hypothetical protein